MATQHSDAIVLGARSGFVAAALESCCARASAATAGAPRHA
ncbi:MAG: hypothetical protein U1E57_00120 [Paenacidovorax caeni]